MGSFMKADRKLDSIYELDPVFLKARGIKGIIFDIDNTLVKHGAPADERSMALIERLKKTGFQIMLLSNNKEPRVKMFNDKVHVSYIFKAGKPAKSGYEKAMSKMGTDRETTMFVGDQLFTDVWGARRVGIFSILTKPIDKKEEIQIILKRRLEWIVLHLYKKKCRKEGREFLVHGKGR